MKIILLKDVAKVGKKNDIKEIKDGYALNLLIPQGLAVPATPDAMKRTKLESSREEGEKKVKEELLSENLKELQDQILEIKGKANDKGHLFAGLHKEAIAEELFRQKRIQVEPSFMAIEHPIKELGDHLIEVKAGGKSAKFTLRVQSSS